MESSLPSSRKRRSLWLMETGAFAAFREAVAKYPDRPAVKDGMGELTYKELDHMSDYVAQKLTENGFGREKVAGIL